MWLHTPQKVNFTHIINVYPNNQWKGIFDSGLSQFQKRDNWDSKEEENPHTGKYAQH